MFQNKSPPFDVSQLDISIIHTIGEKTSVQPCKASSGISSKDISNSIGNALQSKEEYSREPLEDANELANASMNAFTSDFLRRGENISCIDLLLDGHGASAAVSIVKNDYEIFQKHEQHMDDAFNMFKTLLEQDKTVAIQINEEEEDDDGLCLEEKELPMITYLIC